MKIIEIIIKLYNDATTPVGSRDNEFKHQKNKNLKKKTTFLGIKIK